MTARPVRPVTWREGRAVFEEGEMLPVVFEIARLMRSMTPPADPAVLLPWLVYRADLFDRIATATADPRLAVDARAVAAAARHTLADLVAPAATSEYGGDAA